MKTSELIHALQAVEAELGDIECLIEVNSEDCCVLMPVDELSYEDREGYGKSILVMP